MSGLHPEVRRHARQSVHHPGEMGGLDAMQQTAISCPTNISPIEACIGFEGFDASQFDGGPYKVELIFVACSYEALLVVSRYPNSGCKYDLFNLVCMSPTKGTSFSSQLYSIVSECVNVDILNNGILIDAWSHGKLSGDCGYRNLRTWRTLQRRVSEV
ncbi:hypothetical protein EDD16DRAFT_1592776 [Pisolithus croceorrhizus]|nr:hypothetical protein EDD16DRAFT_1592776 [Pisolithus croceorrhizus]